MHTKWPKLSTHSGLFTCTKNIGHSRLTIIMDFVNMTSYIVQHADRNVQNTLNINNYTLNPSLVHARKIPDCSPPW